MKARNAQLDTTGPKASKFETLMAVACSRAGAVAGTMDVSLRRNAHTANRSRRSLAQLHERLNDMHIVLDLIPGEASWQASFTANTIGIVKDTMTRIALERPDLKPN